MNAALDMDAAEALRTSLSPIRLLSRLSAHKHHSNPRLCARCARCSLRTLRGLLQGVCVCVCVCVLVLGQQAADATHTHRNGFALGCVDEELL